jgi:hypothetical protein
MWVCFLYSNLYLEEENVEDLEKGKYRMHDVWRERIKALIFGGFVIVNWWREGGEV